MSIKYTLGADPEFALSKDGTVVSAHDIVPGTKKKPHKLKSGAVQLDGTAVEFNIEPASSPEEFASNIEATLKEIRELIPKEYKFEFKSSHLYDAKTWSDLPNKVKEIGCEPDLITTQAGVSWYPTKRVPLDRNTMYLPFRSACGYGGHIHLGWTSDADVESDEHIFDCNAAVYAMANTIGRLQPALVDPNCKRSSIGYGHPCSYRPKPYGVEYRALPGSWLNYPNLWPFLYELTIAGVEKLRADGKANLYGPYYFRPPLTANRLAYDHKDIPYLQNTFDTVLGKGTVTVPKNAFTERTM